MLDGELHVLHISVMVFESSANALELLESLGEFICHFLNVHGGTNACNNIFALSVGEELTEEALSACCGVTSESNACAAVITHVAECHGLNIYCGAP